MTDYRDKYTLDEMAENDLEMFRHCENKRLIKKEFNNKTHAGNYILACLSRSLKRLGITEEGTAIIFCGLMQSEQKVAGIEGLGIEIELRTYDNGNYEHGKWQRGFYIYKNGELVDFVSKAQVRKPSFLELNPTPVLSVYTTVKPD